VILREPFVAALPESHPLAGEASISLASLAAESFVLFPREIAPALHHQILGICATGGFAPRIVQEADEWHTIFAFVRSGFGVTLSPASLCRLNGPGLIFRSLTDAAAHATISLCWTPDRLSPSVSIFLDFIRSHIHEYRGSSSEKNPL
jgi:DNA-binding transcriptional LysR family regulator